MDITTSARTSVGTAPVGTAPSSGAPDAPLRLAVVIGSNREGRFGPVIADWFLSRLAGRDDFTVDVVDLADIDLPSAPSPTPDDRIAAELSGVSPRLAAADAFVVVTPEYNHSFPAALKALVDWHYTEWRAKPVGFVSYGGISGGLRAVEQLRQVFAELHAVTVRDGISFHNAADHFDAEGRHTAPSGADAAAKTLLDQLAWWGSVLRDARRVRPYAG
ncbi:NADPH-dependent FMN reductase [Streptomyces sp. NPDC059176]|uniref:NADPH-dependent FMN reductase n=1 Tax=unclassified Streptomyces TaxID=2593676 RepID=UPI0036A994AE